MMRRALPLVGVLTIAAAILCAQEAPRFTYERAARTPGSGPSRLAVDVTLLSAGSPFRVVRRGARMVAEDGLKDLRLFDAAGGQVPYLFVHRRDDPAWRGGRILPIATTKTTSGFEVDLGIAQPIDRIRVDGIPGPFLKRLTLEGSGDRAHWTLLQAEGTLFDLPEERIANAELSFTPGDYRYVRITWNDANSGRVPLPGHVVARQAHGLTATTDTVARMPFERRPSEPGRSRYRVRLPAAGLPIVALDLNVAAGHVFRPVTVSESRFTGTEAAPVVLGRGMLVRVLRADAAAESLRVAMASPAEAEIDVTVEDGSNPPLDLLAVSAVFAELPWIYVESSSPSLVARYGDLRAAPPRYDLEAARASIDLARTAEGQWNDARSLAASIPAAAPSPAVSAGAVLEGEFRYARAIAAVERPGLAALPLDAAVLSRSLGPPARFADVRIADAGNRQVPYLLERRDEPLAIELALVPVASPEVPPLPPATAGSRTVYRVALPERRLPAAALTLETSARVFQRFVQVGVVRPPDRNRRDASFSPVSTTTWRHVDEQTATPALALDVGPVDAGELWVIVDEGDNAPLPLTHARLLLPSYRLRFFAPAGTGLRLLYGRDDLAPPRYDLSLLAPRLMGAAASEIGAGPESARAPAARFISPRWFWILLSASVVVLLGLIVRLARRAGS
jgi:hypothetical protein